MTGALIELDGARVTRAGSPVLTGARLRLAPNERLALLGPNGAGKTTLLRTLVGLERLEAGSLRLFGLPCRTEADFRPPRLRLGFLLQDSDDQLFCPTVLEDVSFGPLNCGAPPESARAAARAALQTLGVEHLAGRVAHRLSGGEKRLVCLAGLLAMRPDALLLDEPTNGVDAANRARLLRALSEFDGAMILASHDADFVARLATRAVRIEDGRIAPAALDDPSPAAAS